MASLYVWTPSLTGSFSSNYVESVLRIQKLCQESGIDFAWGSVGKCSMLPAVRNKCVHEFLKSGMTHMLFLDADIGVQSNNVIECVTSNLEFTSLPYAQRHIEPLRLSSMIKAKLDVSLEEVQSMLASPTHQNDTNYETDELALSLGYIQVDAVGTGASVMKREVFEKLSPSTGDYIDFNAYQTEPELIKNYYRYSIDLDGNYVSEDYAFSYAWRSIGGKIFIKESAVTTHEGTINYIHNPLLSKKKTVCER